MSNVPLDPEFLADCPYGPEGLLIDQILLVDKEQQLVRARMPTSDDLPLTREQRAHPVRHPRHVSGGLMVHMTGMMGFAHAYYILGLRHADGWIGYGAKINSARFRALAPPGAPLILECRATQVRRGDSSVFARYVFTFTQEETVVYEGDQVAYWTNVNAKAKPTVTAWADGESAQSAARSTLEAESAQSAARSTLEAESAQSAARSTLEASPE